MTRYAEDAPEINDDTSMREILDFTEKRVREPIVIDDITIYHFSSHKPDIGAFEKAAEQKLQREQYLVPFQVTSVWSLIITLLPRDIRELEFLIYREEREEYFAYNNPIREMPVESSERIQQNFAEIIREEEP